MHPSQVASVAASSASVLPELEPAQEVRPEDARRNPPAPELRVVSETPVERGTAHLRTSILSFSNMHRYGELWAAFMRARKEVFIDRLHWDLPNTDGMEFDQYDTPYARWVVIHEFGEIMAGVRLSPTTAQVGMHSYMLRDAQLGMLESIPTDVLFFEAPVEDRIWEATRLFITEAVSADRRHQVQAALMQGFAQAARAEGATHVIGIVPAVWSRWLRRLDLGAVPVGPRFSIDGTTSQAALFNVMERASASPAAQRSA